MSVKKVLTKGMRNPCRKYEELYICPLILTMSGRFQTKLALSLS